MRQTTAPEDAIVKKAASFLSGNGGCGVAPHLAMSLRSELANIQKGYGSSNKNAQMALKLAELDERVSEIEENISRILTRLEAIETKAIRQPDEITSKPQSDHDTTTESVNEPTQSAIENMLIATWMKAYSDTLAGILSPISDRGKWFSFNGKFRSELLEGISMVLAKHAQAPGQNVNLKEIQEVFAHFQRFFKQVADSDFLCGKIQTQGRAPWKANFTWLSKPENIYKVLEGRYKNRNASSSAQSLSNLNHTPPSASVSNDDELRQAAEVMRQLGDERSIDEILAELKR